ncbi:glucosamine-6-phosphate deaminase [Paenibacillus sp. MSJ-34]|uniref:glucosamine-6-phosphate deaminase n=1 Tax=Paenibacillus sp. MSJ-34 TaxID=2841529 RepID=UPI001C113BDA|nr:glucosamine-6-phosphate deaminase [Paenibacillus sp. MSJ-34]MBU5445002.1 glucosamine-6-phosphate deaminase [Paenibacillus sp. MSJ-34]
MDLYIKKNEDEVDRSAAVVVSRQVVQKPDSVLGLATGNTTEGLYRRMVELRQHLDLDYSRVTTFNLDEYVGLAPTDPISCRARIQQSLLQWLNILDENIFVPNGAARSLEQECKYYEDSIAARGGIDLQILSVGENGHIAFNEPGTAFETTMRVADLADTTVKAKAELFGSIDQVARQGITMGIRNIMMAKRIMLVVKGKHKAKIAERSLFGAVTPNVPASVLQLHPFVTVFMDEEAAGGPLSVCRKYARGE